MAARGARAAERAQAPYRCAPASSRGQCGIIRDLGYVEGTNIIIEWQWAQNVDELPTLAAELRSKFDCNAHHPRLLTAAACNGLRSAHDCRPRRALLHLSYSCAPPFGRAMLVTIDPHRTSERHVRRLTTRRGCYIGSDRQRDIL
jgi:hypothetical protein